MKKRSRKQIWTASALLALTLALLPLAALGGSADSDDVYGDGYATGSDTIEYGMTENAQQSVDLGELNFDETSHANTGVETGEREQPHCDTHDSFTTDAPFCPDCGEHDHNHDPAVWTAWDGGEIDFGEDNVAYLYLTSDLAITETIMIKNDGNGEKTLYLCLNDHVLSYSGSGTNGGLFFIEGLFIDSINDEWSSLNLCDCSGNLGTRHYYDVDSNGLWTLNDSNTTSQYTTTGGVITGCNASSGGVAYLKGTAVFNLYGGTLVGNSAEYGGAVYGSNSTNLFSVYSGRIVGNVAEKNGGSVYLAGGSILNLFDDALIEQNAVSDSSSYPAGGGVYSIFGGMHIYGGTIRNNTASMGADIHFSGGAIYRNSSLYIHDNDFAIDGETYLSGNTYIFMDPDVSLSEGALKIKLDESSPSLPKVALVKVEDTDPLYNIEPRWDHENGTALYQYDGAPQKAPFTNTSIIESLNGWKVSPSVDFIECSAKFVLAPNEGDPFYRSGSFFCNECRNTHYIAENASMQMQTLRIESWSADVEFIDAEYPNDPTKNHKIDVSWEVYDPNDTSDDLASEYTRYNAETGCNTLIDEGFRLGQKYLLTLNPGAMENYNVFVDDGNGGYTDAETIQVGEYNSDALNIGTFTLSDAEGHEGELVAADGSGGTIPVVNGKLQIAITRKKGDLKITLDESGLDSSVTEVEVEVNLTDNGSPLEGTFKDAENNDITFTDGLTTLTIPVTADEDSVTIKDLPAGVYYEVTSSVSGYRLTTAAYTLWGSITDSTTASVTLTFEKPTFEDMAIYFYAPGYPNDPINGYGISFTLVKEDGSEHHANYYNTDGDMGYDEWAWPDYYYFTFRCGEEYTIKEISNYDLSISCDIPDEITFTLDENGSIDECDPDIVTADGSAIYIRPQLKKQKLTIDFEAADGTTLPENATVELRIANSDYEGNLAAVGNTAFDGRLYSKTVATNAPFTVEKLPYNMNFLVEVTAAGYDTTLSYEEYVDWEDMTYIRNGDYLTFDQDHEITCTFTANGEDTGGSTPSPSGADICTVTFMRSSTEEYGRMYIEKGTKLLQPKGPTTTKQEVNSWKKDGATWNFNTAVNEDMTLTAVWTDKPKTGGSGSSSSGGSSSGGGGSSSGGAPVTPSTPTPTPPVVTPPAVDLGADMFNDVDRDAWYYDAVDYVIENGIMQGISDVLFDPNGTADRAQVVTTLWRLEKEPLVSHPLYFSDVSPDAWYGNALRWANSEDLALGYGDGRFGTGDPITREQIATILWRYARYKGIDTSSGEGVSLLKFSDAKLVSDYAISALQWACAEDIIRGTVNPRGELLLDPHGSATRAQIAAILMRFCENIL